MYNKTLVVYAHPYEKSFNHSILEFIKEQVSKKGDQIDVIDLNEDGFNPVITKEDLRLFSKGEFADLLAKDYVERLKTADKLIFIFPIWWYGEPAILKGFFDKVLLKGHTYIENEKGLEGLLRAKEALILTTASINKEYFDYMGNPIENVMINGILGTLGVSKSKWIHCPLVHLEENRSSFVSEIKEYFDSSK